jgi:hypothetical protein
MSQCHLIENNLLKSEQISRVYTEILSSVGLILNRYGRLSSGGKINQVNPLPLLFNVFMCIAGERILS